jgi:hypothetical protein
MTKPKDLLRDLQRLDEAGRDRYLKMLRHEDVVQTLKAALQDSDKALERENYTRKSTYNKVDAGLLTICTEMPTSSKHKVAATTGYATSSRKFSDTQPGLLEKKGNARDIELSPTEMAARKRLRVDRIITPLPDRTQTRSDNVGNPTVTKRSTGFLEYDDSDAEDRMSAEGKVNAVTKASQGTTCATPSTPVRQN